MDSDYIVIAKVLSSYRDSEAFLLAFYGDASDDIASFLGSFYLKDDGGNYYSAPELSLVSSNISSPPSSSSFFKIAVVIDGFSSLDRDDIRRWRGVLFYLRRDSLPSLSDTDEYYHAQIAGFSCIDLSSNSCFGKLEGIANYGSGDLFMIRGVNSKRVIYIPFKSLYVSEIKDRSICFRGIESFIS